MSNSKKSPSDNLADDIKTLAGIVQNQATLPNFTTAGQTSTPPEVEAILQARIAAGNAVVTMRGNYLAAVQANRAEQAATKVVIAGVRKQLIVMHSDSPATLAQYGLVPPKKRVPMTAAEELIASERRKATRVLRNTKGPVQKSKVKGVVPPTITINTTGGAVAPPAVDAAATAAAAANGAGAPPAPTGNGNGTSK